MCWRSLSLMDAMRYACRCLERLSVIHWQVASTLRICSFYVPKISALSQQRKPCSSSYVARVSSLGRYFRLSTRVPCAFCSSLSPSHLEESTWHRSWYTSATTCPHMSIPHVHLCRSCRVSEKVPVSHCLIWPSTFNFVC